MTTDTKQKEVNEKTIVMGDWAIWGAAKGFLGIVPEEYAGDADAIEEWEDCPKDWSAASVEDA